MFGLNLSFQVLLQFLSFVTIWVLEFCHQILSPQRLDGRPTLVAAILRFSKISSRLVTIFFVWSNKKNFVLVGHNFFIKFEWRTHSQTRSTFTNIPGPTDGRTDGRTKLVTSKTTYFSTFPRNNKHYHNKGDIKTNTNGHSDIARSLSRLLHTSLTFTNIPKGCP